MDLSGAASLESIGIYAFGYTRITGTLVIPAKVETIGRNAFLKTKLTGLDLSYAASLKSIGASVFRNTDITGTIVTPFNIPTSRGSCFPAGVSIITTPSLRVARRAVLGARRP